MNNDKKKKGGLRRIIVLILAVAAVICLVAGIRQLHDEKSAGSEYKEVRESAERDVSTAETAVTAASSAAAGTTAAAAEVPIDFTELQKRNPDAYAWIRIPDTVIDYPVLQSADDDNYYLNHSIDRQEQKAGALFTQATYNKKDFSDPNTVIYGHNMRNLSMFGSLKDYRDHDFYENHRTIEVYLPGKVLTYRVFAAYDYDDRHILMSYDFSDRKVFKEYLQDILSRKSMSNNIDTGAGVTADSKIITLSTCNGINDQRFLVQAVLVDE